jgi:16S rRNA (guanine1207-N2)-methyltransferase
MQTLSERYPYYRLQITSAELAGQTIKVCTKPGAPQWTGTTPSTALLAKHVQLEAGSRAVLIGAGNGELAVFLAKKHCLSSFHILDDSIISLRVAQATLQANSIRSITIHETTSLLPDEREKQNAVIMELPKGRKQARRLLVEAFGLLAAGGALYLAGANDQGVQSVIKDAGALFNTKPAILGYKKGRRVARLVKTNQDGPKPEWAGEPGIAPATWLEYSVEVLGERIKLRSLPGVFSHGKLDEGTALLLEALLPVPASNVLDFGCGDGIVGIFLARKGALNVDLVDSSLASVASASENLRINHIGSATVIPSDVLEAVNERRYSLIASNPPFHSGKEVDYLVAETFIQHAHELLEPEARLVLVANIFIRYERLMKKHFRRVEIIRQTNRYHVIAGYK